MENEQKDDIKGQSKNDADSKNVDCLTDDAVEKKNIPKIPKKRGTPFVKGNKFGVRFGSGQVSKKPRVKGVTLMRQSLNLLEENSLEATKYLIEKAMDRNMSPKEQFPWFKELMHRIFGAYKGSMEDLFSKISDRIENSISLNRSVLEATATADAEGLVRELLNQGVLEQVVDKIKNEREPVVIDHPDIERTV